MSEDAVSATPPTPRHLVDLARAANVLLTQMAANPALAQSGVLLGEWCGLELLRNKPSTLRQLGKGLGVSKSRARALLDTLQSRGLITLSEGAPDQAIATLSPQGLETLDQIGASMLAMAPPAGKKLEALSSSLLKTANGLRQAAGDV